MAKIYPIQNQVSLLEKAIHKFKRGVFYCPVCDKISHFKVKSSNIREDLLCFFCHSSNRQRQIASALCTIYSTQKNTKTLSLAKLKSLQNVVLYNTETQGPLHSTFKSIVKNYYCSEYMGAQYKSGEKVGEVIHQDLCTLSLPDESVDLVLSSDVFEHIPDPYKGHESIFRVLRKGGRHVFTVPFYQEEYCDEIRATYDESGNIFYHKEPVYHSDPLRSEGILVYRIFALEMLTKLKHIGFVTTMYQLSNLVHGIYGSNAIVFDAYKPSL